MTYQAFCPEICGELIPCYIEPDITLTLTPVSLGAASIDFNTMTFASTNQQHIGSGFPASSWNDYTFHLTQSILVQFGVSTASPQIGAVSFSSVVGGVTGEVIPFDIPAGFTFLNPLFSYPADIRAARADLLSTVPRPCPDVVAGRIAFIARDNTQPAATCVRLVVVNYLTNTVESITPVTHSLPGFVAADIFNSTDQLSTIKLQSGGLFYYHRSALLSYVRSAVTRFGLSFSATYSNGENRVSNKLGITSVNATNLFYFQGAAFERNTFNVRFSPALSIFFFKRNGLFPTVVNGGANMEFLCSPFATDELGLLIPATNNAFVSPTQTVFDAASAVVFPYGRGSQYFRDAFASGFGSRGDDECLGRNRDVHFNGTFSGARMGSLNYQLSDSGFLTWPGYDNPNITAFYYNSSLALGIKAPITARIDPSTRREILFTGGVATTNATNALSFGNTIGFARTYQYVEPTENPDVQRITISSILWVISDGSRRDVLDVYNMLAVI